MKLMPSTAFFALIQLLSSAQAQTADLGRITVTGEGDKLGTGLIVDEDTPKAKSTVTKAQLEKMRPTTNPFQALALLPGVNSLSTDATGLFGGNLRVRGFNSDQMGFTVNGSPVNDSGNFAVFPQEYVDGENLCELYVTQGATDTDAPHVGASGGNVGIQTCAPIEQRRVRASLSGGQLDFKRAFLRVDTGRIGGFKGMMSISNARVDKWRGLGQAKRTHIDAATEYQVGEATFSASLLYNRAINNNFNAQTLADFGSKGYFSDYSTTIPQHVTPGPGAQVDANPSPVYYRYSVNPFKNGLITGKASLPLTPSMRLDVEPYFWYGYGTGGNQQNTIKESSGGAFLGGGVLDVNGDGDSLDTVLVYRSNVTTTHRPGLTTRLNVTLPGHQIVAGFWYEHARHRQTGPATYVDNNGGVANVFLDKTGTVVRRADSSLYEGRDQITISTGKSVFISDAIALASNQFTLVPGLSWRGITRDFTNYANDAANNGATYRVNESFYKLLPSLAASLRINESAKLFASASKNFRVSNNSEYQNGVASTPAVVYVNGVPTSYTIALPNQVKPETSVNIDIGLRFKGAWGNGSVTAFHSALKDRISRSTDPATTIAFDTNVGSSTIEGLEIEFGTVPVKGFSMYASGTYTESILKGDLPGQGTAKYPTAGKQFPDTPILMAALALQWAQGPYMVNVAGKYTGPRAITLTNDQTIGGFTSVDLNAAYQLPNLGFIKSPILRLNVSNLFNVRYMLANNGSGSNIQTAAFSAPGLPGTAPVVYTGAPRFASVTLQADY